MKEAIDKAITHGKNEPRRVILNNREIYDEIIIANNFNDYYVNVGSNLAAKFHRVRNF